jgi:hypothetical protein
MNENLVDPTEGESTPKFKNNYYVNPYPANVEKSVSL